MKKVVKKLSYDAPKVKVVPFMVEQGFAGTGPVPVGNELNPGTQQLDNNVDDPWSFNNSRGW